MPALIIEKLHPDFGARLTGVDMRAPLDEDTLEEIRAAIDLARLWQDQGRISDAVALLDPVHRSIADGDCPEEQSTAGALLAELAG